MNAPLLAASFVAGIAVGLAYFALLVRTVRLFTGGAHTLPVIALYAARAALAIGAFLGLAALGGLPLLAGLGGFVVARLIVQRHAGFGE